MSESTLSTIIATDVKKAAISFCKKRGLKLRHLIEQAIVEQIEDEIDLEAYHARRDEETIPLEKVLKGLKK